MRSHRVRWLNANSAHPRVTSRARPRSTPLLRGKLVLSYYTVRQYMLAMYIPYRIALLFVDTSMSIRRSSQSNLTRNADSIHRCEAVASWPQDDLLPGTFQPHRYPELMYRYSQCSTVVQYSKRAGRLGHRALYGLQGINRVYLCKHFHE